MELYALDKDYGLVSLLSPNLIQWNRMYYTCGNFLLRLTPNQYSKNMEYIFTKDRVEVGRIQKVSYVQDDDGAYVELSGNFLESVLNDAVIYPTYKKKAKLTDIVVEMVRTYATHIRIDEINVLCDSEEIEFEATGDNLDEKIYEILQTQEISYRIYVDFVNDKVIMDIYKGEDRTQSANKDYFVTFSTEWDNMDDVIVDLDSSNYKNYFIIAGADRAENRKVLELDLREDENEPIRKQYIDARDLTYDKDKMKESEYFDLLTQRGYEKSLNYMNVQNVNFGISMQGYRYLTDYDIGTKVDGYIKEIDATLKLRISRIYEVFKDGRQTLEVEVGDALRNEYHLVQ